MTAETAGAAKDRASIFISYRRSDQEAADRLYELLKERNVTAWYDPLILHGTDWREAIVKHLAPARVMVVLLSSAAQESDELRKELAFAAEKGVPLLPVRLEDIELQGAFAYELSRGNWFDVFDDPPMRLTALADLLAEISKTPREADLGPFFQRWQQRWRQLTDRRLRRWTHKNRVVVPLFLLFSLVVFLLYDDLAKPMENLTLVSPLVASFYLAFVATIGSPVILVSLLRGGVGGSELPLLAAASVNTALLALLVKNVFSWVYRQILRRRT